jgi:hypothetical protein
MKTRAEEALKKVNHLEQCKVWISRRLTRMTFVYVNMLNVEHVCFQQRVPLDICLEKTLHYSIFNVKRKKENQKEFLFINFMLAVNML